MVKKIEAIIPPIKFDSVKVALNRQDVDEFVVARVDVDEPDDIPDEPRWSNHSIDAFTPRMKLELTVTDEIVSRTIKDVRPINN